MSPAPSKIKVKKSVESSEVNIMMAAAPQYLLSEPSKQDESFSKSLKRHSCSYESHCDRFKVENRVFNQQYSHVYFMRLAKMRERIKKMAKQKWGKEGPLVFPASQMFDIVCIWVMGLGLYANGMYTL